MSDVPLEEEDSAPWHQAAAGVIVGVAAGGFLMSLLTHLYIRMEWPVYRCNYEPAAALLGGLGVWAFSPGRGLAKGLLGAGAALAAMLLGDTFQLLSDSPTGYAADVPRRLLGLFRLSDWPMLVRYAFGVYIGWYVCSADRGEGSGPTRPGSQED